MGKVFVVSVLLCVVSLLWGLRLPDGTVAAVSNVERDFAGRITSVMLLEPTHLNTAVGRLEFAADTVSFHRNGRIGSGWLSKSHVVHTPVGRLGLIAIYFRESGNLYGGSLCKPQIVNTPAGRLELCQIWFNESGRLGGGTFSKPQVVNISGKRLNLRAIWFYESGRIDGGTLSEPQIVNTPSGRLNLNVIWFHQNGRIRAGGLAEDKTIGRVRFRRGTYLGWDENGRFLGEITDVPFQIFCHKFC